MDDSDVESPADSEPPPRIVVDLHPDRPTARGIAPPPTHDKVIGRLPADPTFEEIERAGAEVETHSEGHVIAGGTVYISGEIPRGTTFEQGLLGGMRWVHPEGEETKGKWASEPVCISIWLASSRWDC